ncbi:MAG: ABC-F family ATP-binding cassette domain-containing protein [Candidatus Cloacimonadia bacterium]
MSVISLSNITHYFGANSIFTDLSLTIDKDKRIGLVGRNGSGKTTLLEIIKGNLLTKEGTVTKTRGCQIAYLNQTFQIDSPIKLWEYVLSSHRSFFKLSHKIKALELEIADNPSEGNFKKLDLAHREFAAIDGYSLETKAEIILEQLGFTKEDRVRNVDTFSGGEKTRIQLASILLQPADILLLDEPTNHLDLKMRNWLISFLKELTIPYIIVSHDRHFLDKTINTTISIENKNIVSYSGNYTFFVQEQAIRKELQAKEFKAQQNWIDETEDFIRRNMAGQKTKQAQARLKALNKLNRVDRPEQNKEYRLNFTPTSRSGNIVFSFEDLAFGFPNKILVKDFSGHIHYQDRLALLGDNGSGKSTFLQMLVGLLKPTAGKLNKGASIQIGYYDQLQLNLNNSLTVKETINYEHVTWENQKVLSFLAKFGFIGDEIDKRVGTLSGGEKARLYLALLIARKPNVLIMDEPTNHLDTFLISALEQALDEFEGTVIFVSHDRYFIENIADRYWVIKEQQIVETDDWEKTLLEEPSKQAREKKERTDTRTKERRINPITLELLLKNIDKKQLKVDSITKDIRALEEMFLQPEIMRDENKVKELYSQIELLKTEVNALEKVIEEKEEEYLNSI